MGILSRRGLTTHEALPPSVLEDQQRLIRSAFSNTGEGWDEPAPRAYQGLALGDLSSDGVILWSRCNQSATLKVEWSRRLSLRPKVSRGRCPEQS